MCTQALLSRQFHFVGRLMGERAINLKRIEAISWAQLRYSHRGLAPNSKHSIAENAYIQITGTSEQVQYWSFPWFASYLVTDGRLETSDDGPCPQPMYRPSP
jgi:hypothetical protein